MAAEALRPESFSPDATVIAGAGDEGVLMLLETATGRVLRKSTGHTGKIYVVEFSPDGKPVASSGDGGVVEVWETRTLQPVRQFSASHNTVLSLGFSPMGERSARGP